MYESWLKCCVGVKDSGNILFGYGGIFDWFDGLVLVVLVVVLFVILLNFY